MPMIRFGKDLTRSGNVILVAGLGDPLISVAGCYDKQ